MSCLIPKKSDSQLEAFNVWKNPVYLKHLAERNDKSFLILSSLRTEFHKKYTNSVFSDSTRAFKIDMDQHHNIIRLLLMQIVQDMKFLNLNSYADRIQKTIELLLDREKFCQEMWSETVVRLNIAFREPAKYRNLCEICENIIEEVKLKNLQVKSSKAQYKNIDLQKIREGDKKDQFQKARRRQQQQRQQKELYNFLTKEFENMISIINSLLCSKNATERRKPEKTEAVLKDAILHFSSHQDNAKNYVSDQSIHRFKNGADLVSSLVENLIQKLKAESQKMLPQFEFKMANLFFKRRFQEYKRNLLSKGCQTLQIKGKQSHFSLENRINNLTGQLQLRQLKLNEVQVKRLQDFQKLKDLNKQIESLRESNIALASQLQTQVTKLAELEQSVNSQRERNKEKVQNERYQSQKIIYREVGEKVPVSYPMRLQRFTQTNIILQNSQMQCDQIFMKKHLYLEEKVIKIENLLKRQDRDKFFQKELIQIDKKFQDELKQIQKKEIQSKQEHQNSIANQQVANQQPPVSSTANISSNNPKKNSKKEKDKDKSKVKKYKKKLADLSQRKSVQSKASKDKSSDKSIDVRGRQEQKNVNSIFKKKFQKQKDRVQKERVQKDRDSNFRAQKQKPQKKNQSHKPSQQSIIDRQVHAVTPRQTQNQLKLSKALSIDGDYKSSKPLNYSNKPEDAEISSDQKIENDEGQALISGNSKDSKQFSAKNSYSCRSQPRHEHSEVQENDIVEEQSEQFEESRRSIRSQNMFQRKKVVQKRMISKRDILKDAVNKEGLQQVNKILGANLRRKPVESKIKEQQLDLFKMINRQRLVLTEAQIQTLQNIFKEMTSRGKELFEQGLIKRLIDYLHKGEQLLQKQIVQIQPLNNQSNNQKTKGFDHHKSLSPSFKISKQGKPSLSKKNIAFQPSRLQKDNNSNHVKTVRMRYQYQGHTFQNQSFYNSVSQERGMAVSFRMLQGLKKHNGQLQLPNQKNQQIFLKGSKTLRKQQRTFNTLFNQEDLMFFGGIEKAYQYEQVDFKPAIIHKKSVSQLVKNLAYQIHFIFLKAKTLNYHHYLNFKNFLRFPYELTMRGSLVLDLSPDIELRELEERLEWVRGQHTECPKKVCMHLTRVFMKLGFDYKDQQN